MRGGRVAAAQKKRGRGKTRQPRTLPARCRQQQRFGAAAEQPGRVWELEVTLTTRRARWQVVGGHRDARTGQRREGGAGRRSSWSRATTRTGGQGGGGRGGGSRCARRRLPRPKIWAAARAAAAGGGCTPPLPPPPAAHAAAGKRTQARRRGGPGADAGDPALARMASMHLAASGRSGVRCGVARRTCGTWPAGGGPTGGRQAESASGVGLVV